MDSCKCHHENGGPAWRCIAQIKGVSVSLHERTTNEIEVDQEDLE